MTKLPGLITNRGHDSNLIIDDSVSLLPAFLKSIKIWVCFVFFLSRIMTLHCSKPCSVPLSLKGQAQGLKWPSDPAQSGLQLLPDPITPDSLSLSYHALVSFSFLGHLKYIPTSGPLHLLFPLPFLRSLQCLFPYFIQGSD